MGLRDRITVGAKGPKGFSAWLASLSPEHREVLEAWRLDPTISIRQIVDAVRDDDPEDGFLGVKVSRETISAWRRGESR